MALTEEDKVVAVADASFLIGLSMIGRLSLVDELTDRLVVAPAVWEEVVERGQGRPGQEELAEAGFVEVRAATNRQAVRMFEVFLGRGEAESLVLVQEVEATLLFADDLRARRAAQAAGITAMGVAGVLLAAKRAGLLSEVRPLLEELGRCGFRLSRALIRKVLCEAGEAAEDVL